MYKLVEKFAFFPPNPPSYDRDFRNRSLRFIPKDARGSSAGDSHNSIPYMLYFAPAPKGYFIEIIRRAHVNTRYGSDFADLGQNDPWMLEASVRLNVNVLSYDYTGYGLNGTVGQCSESDCYKDISLVVAHATRELGIPYRKIILWGRSLGSGPTTHMAAELSKQEATRIAGVILQSPLASASRVVTDKLAWVPWGDIFQNIDKISKIEAPILIAHGTVDEVVPYNHGEQLARKLEKEHRPLWKLLSIKGAGHNDIESQHADELLNCMQDFLSHLTQTPAL